MKVTQPQYQVIYNFILKKINKGNYTKEEPVPSENELAEKFSVSRMTARKSIDMLVSEGYLQRQKGRGTFITGRRNFVKPSISLSERLKEDGIRIYSEVLSLEKTYDQPMEVREALNLVEEEAWHIERIRYANDVPCIIENIWISVKNLEFLEEKDITQSIKELSDTMMGEAGILDLEVFPHILKKKEAKLLNLKKDDLVLKVIGELKSMEDEILIYSESIQNNAVIPFKQRVFR